MKLTNLLSFSLISVALVACASNDDNQGATGAQPDHTQARRAFDGASGAIDTAFAHLGSQSRIAPFGGTVDFSEPCSLSGSLDLNGSYDDSDAGTSIDLVAGFNACEEAEGTLGGSLHWVSSMSGTHIEDHWTGTLTLDDPSGSYSCAFDLHAITDDFEVTYNGSICGYDVSADLGL